jgi:hypothetical protein
MIPALIRKLLLCLLVLSGTSYFASGSDSNKGIADKYDTTIYRSPFFENNERCFKCHGQNRYEYTNENLGHQIKAMMFSERVIERGKFYGSNHKSFSCTDCHSEEYVKFPHAGELRMEQSYNCIDCHGGDDKFSRFNFETIEEEYKQSIHYKLEDEGFTCWKCHDPHSYRISIRNSENLKEAILYDNNICLNCHSDYNRFKLLSDKEEISIIQKHDWLPNQEAHFKNVRCLECHTQINDTILVAHLIKPKEDAVKACNECHSRNSILMSTLYKFQSKEQRKNGFFNGTIMNESYVIGANRNQYLNNLSYFIFTVLSGVIFIHIIFRIRKKS